MNSDFEMLDARAVAAIIGGSKGPVNTATVFRRVRKGTLPAPVRLSQRLVRWNKAELVAWLTRRSV